MSIKIDNQFLSLIISDRTQDLNLDLISAAEWDLLSAKAQAEGVAPLLYWVLSRAEKFSRLPESARYSLRSMYAQTWKENQKILNELESLAHLFDRAHIPIVVLKGACFALTIYADIGLRPMGDLDILAPKEKLNEAVQLARSLGYEQTLPEAVRGLDDLLSHHVLLQKTGSGSVILEIHASLVADKSFEYAAPVDWFWEQTEPLIASFMPQVFESLRMLTPCAQILYGAAHAMLQHGGRISPLRWYYDLDKMIRVYRQRIEWDLLLSQASRFEWGSALAAALSQTISYFDTPVPGAVRARLAELTDRHQPRVEFLRNKPATHILEERQKLLALNWGARFKLILALIAPSPAYMRWRYDLKTSWALPAYYIFRWWGIFKDGLRTLASFFN